MAISLEKTGKLVGEAAVGARVEWSFTITNTGTTALAEVDLVDHLAGVSDLSVDWAAGEEGRIEPGASVTAHASSEVTAQDLADGKIVNTATVTGVGGGAITVTADAEAAVVLPATASPDNGSGAQSKETSQQADPSDVALAVTGAEAGPWIAGLVLLLGAAGVFAITRRRSASRV
ncbi:hypothetical protein G7067_11005 [Leucobacter insecticola]|uniref:DUF7507 domain-containing protein n=1 Tax=Leucobacter insecticola TaxID=2714934 RepID=A0A6G8FKD4_9MICO|nr:hypothetical protein [Leucobacter insecticola]QIM16808.1 hypothetical protein G7067_11005 [Leucobacter insecticola]